MKMNSDLFKKYGSKLKEKQISYQKGLLLYPKLAFVNEMLKFGSLFAYHSNNNASDVRDLINTLWGNGFVFFDVKLIGTFKDMTYNGQIIYDFANKYKGKISNEKIKVLLEKANFKFTYTGGLDILINKLKFDYIKQNNEYRLLFTRFKNNIDFNHIRFKLMKFNSGFYDGKLEGKGHIDTAVSPFGLLLNFDVNGLSTEPLESIIPFFAKIKGKAEIQANYRNRPGKKFQGSIIVRDGTLNNLQFLDWLSKFFKIPHLKRIEFSNLSANFLVNTDIYLVDSHIH